jgi:hypothetical protein
MAAEWYVSIDGCQKGPFSTPELYRWIREGKVAKDSLVKEGPNGAWVLAREIRVPSDRSAGQALLNLIGFSALLAIGVELYLFMMTHPVTKQFAIWGVGLYLLVIVGRWCQGAGKKPVNKPG